MSKKKPFVCMFGHADLMEVTDMEYMAVAKHISRGTVEPNLRSVLLWCTRHAKDDLRQDLLNNLINRPVGAPPKKTRKKKASSQKTSS